MCKLIAPVYVYMSLCVCAFFTDISDQMEHTRPGWKHPEKLRAQSIEITQIETNFENCWNSIIIYAVEANMYRSGPTVNFYARYRKSQMELNPRA